MENADQDVIEGNELTFTPTKSTSEGIWKPMLGLVQIRRLRGNFWKKYGFSINGVDFLYPEEALSLYERKIIAVFGQDGRQMDKRELFEAVLSVIPLSCYLAYAKLKASQSFACDSNAPQVPYYCIRLWLISLRGIERVCAY